jgi:hypothetical protein
MPYNANKVRVEKIEMNILWAVQPDTPINSMNCVNGRAVKKYTGLCTESSEISA